MPDRDEELPEIELRGGLEYRVHNNTRKEGILAPGWWKGVLLLIAVFVGAFIFAHVKGWLRGVMF